MKSCKDYTDTMIWALLLCALGVMLSPSIVASVPDYEGPLDNPRRIEGVPKGNENSMGKLIDRGALGKGSENSQKRTDIDNNGTVDIETAKRNVVDTHARGLRVRRFVIRNLRWPKNFLTYRILNYPSNFKDHRVVDEAIEQAFAGWSKYANVKFARRNLDEDTDMEISFQRGNHSDGSPFDNKGGTLAHAFYPTDGVIHFDDDEKWGSNSTTTTDLYMVAIHEIGHALGLDHSTDSNAVMFPTYNGYVPNYGLGNDDIQGIQAMFGAKVTKTQTPSRTPEITPKVDMCADSRLDAITRTSDNIIYVFRGSWYWKINYIGVLPGYPRLIRDYWTGVPDNIDAALSLPGDKTLLFKGELYWKFINGTPSKGYPREVSTGHPKFIDAAFYWSLDKAVYFFKGDKYWRYCTTICSPEANPQYISTKWRGVPPKMHGAFSLPDGTAYFFYNQHYVAYFEKYKTIYPYRYQDTKPFLFDCWKRSNRINVNRPNGLRLDERQRSRQDARKVDGRQLIRNIQVASRIEASRKPSPEAYTN